MTLLALIIAGGLGWWFYRQYTAPVRAAAEAPVAPPPRAWQRVPVPDNPPHRLHHKARDDG